MTKSVVAGMIASVTRYLALWALTTCLACERAEVLGRFADAGAPSGSAGGGGAPEPGVPRPVGVVSDPEARDTDPTFTLDRLELYFMSVRGGSKDLWKSTRTGVTQAWEPPVALGEVNSSVNDENPRVSPDGLLLWFYTDRDRARGTIWQSSRPSRADAWAEPLPVPGFPTDGSNVSACVDGASTLAVFAARPAGSGGYELLFAERSTPDGVFGEASSIDGVNSASDDFDPFLSPNGLGLAFHTNRQGTDDIFLARRTATGAAFEAPVAMAELNSAEYSESAPAFSPDLGYVMFSSDRLGSDDIFEAVLFP